MGKLAQDSIKYIIKGQMKAEGVVEKSDIVGAIFGQTEGILGADLDLRELQRTGRVGRIKVEVESHSGSAQATIEIPSSLDLASTSLLAASLETINRVGPCQSDIEVEKVEDVRERKREYIIDRAKELVSKTRTSVPDTQKITEELKEDLRASEVSEYKGLPSGPDLESYDSVIVVEGRADVLNLLKKGIKNVIAIGGTSVPATIEHLSSRKVITVFLDGDRGGDLILKELVQKGNPDYIARAPDDKEVEELTKKEIYKALRDKVALEQVNTEMKKNLELNGDKSELALDQEEAKKFKEILEQLVGTRAVHVLDDELSTLDKLPLSECFSALEDVDRIYAIVVDGKINNKLLNLAKEKGARFLVGMSEQGMLKSEEVESITKRQLENYQSNN